MLPNPFPAGVTVTTTATTVVTQAKSEYKFKRAGTNGNLINIIIDESGSMRPLQYKTIAGFNEYLEGQQAVKDAGNAYITLNKFDAPHIKTVYANRPIAEAPKLTDKTYNPGGGTNLLDAVGYTINQINETLAIKPKAERPGVIVVIMTDGEENSSVNYNNEQIKAMVAAAEKADWSFIFMGANIDSFAVGSKFGMNNLNTVNYSVSNLGETYSSLNATTTRMRSAKMAGMDTQTVYATSMFSDIEKKSMVEGKE